MRSPDSMGIGSSGISLVPILPITVITSGKSRCRIVAARCAVSIVAESELPVGRRISTAKSPSSSCGMNSEPIDRKTMTARPRAATDEVMTAHRQRRARRRMGSYDQCRKAITRSARVTLVDSSLLRNRSAVIIGTYVVDRMKAPRTANITVSAIGRNILPSMPTSTRMGT